MPLFVRTLLVTGPEDEVAPARLEHEAQLARLRAAGKVRAAGRFSRGDGYLEIFDTVDLLEAESIARMSPLVEQGLGTWMLREWDEIPL